MVFTTGGEMVRARGDDERSIAVFQLFTSWDNHHIITIIHGETSSFWGTPSMDKPG